MTGVGLETMPLKCLLPKTGTLTNRSSCLYLNHQMQAF
eukprot:UN11306